MAILFSYIKCVHIWVCIFVLLSSGVQIKVTLTFVSKGECYNTIEYEMNIINENESDLDLYVVNL